MVLLALEASVAGVLTIIDWLLPDGGGPPKILEKAASRWAEEERPSHVRAGTIVAALLGLILCHVACPEVVAASTLPERHPGPPPGRWSALGRRVVGGLAARVLQKRRRSGANGRAGGVASWSGRGGAALRAVRRR